MSNGMKIFMQTDMHEWEKYFSSIRNAPFF